MNYVEGFVCRQYNINWDMTCRTCYQHRFTLIRYIWFQLKIKTESVRQKFTFLNPDLIIRLKLEEQIYEK